MLFALIGLAVVVVGLLVGVVLGQQKAAGLEEERNDARQQLSEASTRLKTTGEQLEASRATAADLDARRGSLEASVKQFETKYTEASEALRKRTELADAQAMQIDSLSAERDDLRQQVVGAEERLVTMAARPGVVVGAAGSDAAVATTAEDASMLWDLEVARSERLWRNSVAINPMGDASPFDDTDDPTRQAVEIEAAALREDVGALITVVWQAKPIDAPARRLMVVRVAQEMLATASRAPGAARLVVEEVASGEGAEPAVGAANQGELTMRFESADDGEVINLIPPQISSDLVDVRNGTTLTLRAPETAAT